MVAATSRPGRLEPEQWDDDVTDPRIDAYRMAELRLRARLDHELGADLGDVQPEGWVS